MLFERSPCKLPRQEDTLKRERLVSIIPPDHGNLIRLAGLNAPQLNRSFRASGDEGLGEEFGAIVEPKRLRMRLDRKLDKSVVPPEKNLDRTSSIRPKAKLFLASYLKHPVRWSCFFLNPARCCPDDLQLLRSPTRESLHLARRS